MPDLNIFNALLVIQKKHSAYFSNSKTTILDYVAIDWVPPVSVTIDWDDIPAEIMDDITMYLLPMNKEQ